MLHSETTIRETISELRRRSEHNIHTYKPGDTDGWNQKSFHESPDRYRLLFGGNQSGKSQTAAYEIACWLRGEHPYRTVPPVPNKIWAISAEYITLQEGIYRHLRTIIPDWEVDKFGPNVPQQDLPAYMRLKNGSQVDFKSAKGGREKFQAAAVDLISIDEEVDDTIWTELQARTLATGGNFIISATLIESYEWICLLEEYADNGKPDYFITRLDTTKNPYLHKPTVEHLLETWSDEEKEVRILGRSRRSTGLVYNTWDKTKHIISPFPIPEDWPRWCALDPGIRTFAVLWIAVGPDNRAYAYRELYAHSMPLWEVASEIKGLEGCKLDRRLSDKYEHFVWEETAESEHMVMRLIDDKVGSRLITGDEGVMGQLYERYGLGTVPADKSMRAGIEDVRHWLEPLVAKQPNEPAFMCFSNLDNFLRERAKYRIRMKPVKKDSNEAIDEPLRKDNHLMDCWRYISRERPKYKDKELLGFEKTAPTGFAQLALRQKKREMEHIHEYLGTEW